MTDYLSIPNFEKWQHYKDRTPPWIKLHRDLLHNYEFVRLPDDTKAHLILIWILGSQLDNKIPNDAEYIQKQIGAINIPNIQMLIDSGFLAIVASRKQRASKPLAKCSTLSNMRETETETETENPLPLFPEWIPKEDWEGWVAQRKKKPTPRAIELAIKKLTQLRSDGFDPGAVLQHCIISGYEGIFPPKQNGYSKPVLLTATERDREARKGAITL